ncbi:MFS transporter [Erwinia billingiae]|uniref:MFS transporter n=1 Tax=Erwinia billingiae TaxID=182337 RepID=UPI0032098601
MMITDSAMPVKATRFRWMVAAIFFLVYMVAAADRANFGVAMPFIRKEYEISNTEAGAIISIFLLFYAIFQIPSAWLLSRYSTRKIVPLAMIGTSIATAVIGMTSSLHQLLASRALLGVTEAPLPLGITSTINRWFPVREKGTASGIFLAAAKFGPVIVPPVCTLIAAIWGWREIFYIFAVPGILLSVVWFKFITQNPSESPRVNEAELWHIGNNEKSVEDTSHKSGIVRSFPVLDRIIRVRDEKPLTTSKAVFRSWNVIGSGIGYCFQVGITNVLMAWIPTWLLTVKHFSLVDMGIVASAPWVGAVVGNLLGGILSDTVLGGRRKPGMIISALATCVMMGLIVMVPGGALYYGIMLFLTGVLLCIGYSNYMSYPMGVVSKDRYPMACAIVNTAGQLGGAAAPLAMGYILDVAGWDAGFIFLAVISLLTFFILMTMTEPLNQSH